MSFVQPSNIQVIAESLGLRVKDEALRALAPDVEYRLREIIQEGAKFMRHAKRAYLTTEDVNNALRLRNVEPLYGFGSNDPVRFLRTAGFPDVFYAEDTELSIEQAITAPLPKCPVEVGVVPHWLAIDGVQPAIPENAPLERTRGPKRPRLDKKSGAAAGAAAAGAAAQQAQQAQQQPKAAAAGAGAAGTAAAAAGGEEGAAGGAGGTTLVRAPVKHVVSQELQLYFDRVARLLRGAQPAHGGGGGGGALTPAVEQQQLQRAVLASLAVDPGLQPLAPYLVKLLSEGVGSQLKSLPQLLLLLSAARALVVNPHLDLSPYLHQLMPALMTCLVAKRLGGGPAEDHWSVRGRAAGVVAAVCRRYSADYENVAPRVQKTLIKALQDTAKPLTTHYGAVMGLAALGPRVVQLMILPSLQPYMAMLSPKLLPPPGAADPGAAGAAAAAAHVSGALGRMEALRVQGALLAAAAGCVFRFMGGSLPAVPGKAIEAAAAAAGPSTAQSQGQQQQAAAAAAAAGQQAPPAKAAAAGSRRREPLLLLQRHRGRLARVTPPPQQQRQPGGVHSMRSAAQRAPSAAVQALFPAGDSGEGEEGTAAAGPQRVAAQLSQYAQRHPMRLANGGLGPAAEGPPPPSSSSSREGGPSGPSGASGAISSGITAGMSSGAGERNELAEAWREGFDPGVAAHAVFSIFGEAALPYLPGSALAGVQL